MKNQLKTTTLFTTAYFFLSIATAFADDFQLTRTGNNPVNITFCDTEEAAARLAWISESTPYPERIETIPKTKTELNCRDELQESNYMLHGKNYVKPNQTQRSYEILDILYQPNNQHKFINSGSIGPYTYSDTSCQPNALGGQVNRMEADKDGRLYLKKYMVTSTCVNGKNKAVWKPLN